MEYRDISGRAHRIDGIIHVTHRFVALSSRECNQRVTVGRVSRPLEPPQPLMKIRRPSRFDLRRKNSIDQTAKVSLDRVLRVYRIRPHLGVAINAPPLLIHVCPFVMEVVVHQ